MNEADLYQIAMEMNHGLQTEEQTFLTVLSGYLIAAYVIGAKVTRSQIVIFNAIYVVVACGLLYNMHDYWANITHWFTKAQTAEFGKVMVDLTLRGELTVLACASMVVGSLYFMWSIRHSEPE
ncbi:hypothetical protein R0135_01290 [Congregibacter variabilis]|uniref:Uncharacterized protein n=1 Tax=Congregibacter variabilis TaxID=3081200 RepID=A0ABZ0I2V5_9GAMM|nr:hypothetical protein R0135_01290 [Congregibacter sp. IMCC43200]